MLDNKTVFNVPVTLNSAAILFAGAMLSAEQYFDAENKERAEQSLKVALDIIVARDAAFPDSPELGLSKGLPHTFKMLADEAGLSHVIPEGMTVQVPGFLSTIYRIHREAVRKGKAKLELERAQTEKDSLPSGSLN